MNEQRDGTNEVEMELWEGLATTECPFTWMPNRSDFGAVDPEYILKKNQPKDKNDNFTIYSKYMRKVFELGNKNDELESAIQTVEQWEDFLTKTATEDEFFMKIYLALKHVLYSSKAHLISKTGEYDKAQNLLENIDKMKPKLHENVLKAAMFGLKAKFFDEYGSQGHKIALPEVRRALELDPEEAEWVYLLGKTLRDIRRGVLFNMDGTVESRYQEFNLFEKAVRLKGKAIYFIRLGNSYHSIADYLIHENRYNNHFCRQGSRCGRCDDVYTFYKKGVDCFRKGINKDPKIKNYRRVVSGIIGIPYHYRTQYKIIAKKWIHCILNSGLDIEEDSETQYVIGRYYQFLEQNRAEAVKYISRAAQLGGLNAKKDMIRMRFDRTSGIYDPHKSPEEEILEIMKAYPEKPKIIECLCQLASYYLFKKNDILKATRFILDEQKEDPKFESLYLEKHKSWFYEQRKHRNLLVEITGMVKHRLELLGEEDESEEKKELMHFQAVACEAIH